MPSPTPGVVIPYRPENRYSFTTPGGQSRYGPVCFRGCGTGLPSRTLSGSVSMGGVDGSDLRSAVRSVFVATGSVRCPCRCADGVSGYSGGHPDPRPLLGRGITVRQRLREDHTTLTSF